MRKRHVLASVLFLAVLACTACGTPTQADVEHEAQTISSWAATAHATGEAWLRAQVPSAYARQTLVAAQQSLQEENDTLAQMQLASNQRTALLTHSQRLAPLFGQMAQAVEQQNRATFAQQMAILGTEQQALAALAGRAKAQP